MNLRKHWLLTFTGLSLLLNYSFSKQAKASAVATSSPQATQAAMDVLKAGGNAVDAACTAVWVISVTQPYFTGPGAGGFSVVQEKGKQTFYDFREEAPASTQSNLFLKPDGKPIESWDERNTGPKSIAIPGLVAGCGEMIRNHGTVTWKSLFAPAIQIAHQGFLISEMFSEEMADQFKRISPFAFSKETFKGKEGNGLKKGETLTEPVYAKTLEKMSGLQPQDFYSGVFATAWLGEAQKLNVPITSDDLKNYKAIKRDTTKFQFGKYTGVTASLPSVAGLMVGEELRYLNHYNKKFGTPKKDSPARYIAELETSNYLRKIKEAKLTDPRKSKLNPASFYNTKDERKAWSEIDNNIKDRLKKLKENPPSKKTALIQNPQNPHSSQNSLNSGLQNKENSHTTHMSIVDDKGMAVAMTSSIADIFGSGITVPDYGFILNSSMADFDEHPADINAPAAGMRPRSNQSPTLLYERTSSGPQLVAVLGAAGGSYIPTVVVQFFQNYFVYGLDRKDAVAFPRAHATSDLKIEVEKAASPELIASLQAAGYTVSVIDTVWAVFEGAMRRDSKSAWEAVAETRYDGTALVSPLHAEGDE